MKRHIRPVAKANGIHKNIGWHTFRHSFGTLLKANGEDVKTVQELLRHANSRITLDVYTQAVNSNKRAAQSKVVRMMVQNMGQLKGQLKNTRQNAAVGGLLDPYRDPDFVVTLGPIRSVSLWNVWRGRRGSNPRPLP